MIAETLPVARDFWSRIVERAYPLYGSREVVVQCDPKSSAPTEFYTDNEKIYVCLNRPQEASAEFRKHVLPVYRPSLAALYPGARAVPDDVLERNLWVDTLLFVLFHELYHPLICPNSAEDEKEISRALYRGIKAALPTVDALSVLRRVVEIKNLVWDLVVNVAFLARLGGADYDPLRSGCGSVFARADRRIDVAPIRAIPPPVVPAVYYQSAATAHTDLLIAIMGTLYTVLSTAEVALRERLLDGFRREAARLQAPKPPENLAVEMLQAIGIDPARDPLGELQKVFGRPAERYRAIEAVGKFLAPFLKGAGKQGSVDQKTRGQGSGVRGPGSGVGGQGEDSTVDTMQDVLESLPKKEADDLLRGAAQPESDYDEESPSYTWKPLTVAAADEFYKRHSEPLGFRNPEQRAAIYELGKQKRWRIRNVWDLTAPEATQLDIDRVLTFQSATGLPVMMNLAEGFYRVHEYVLQETPIRSYTLQTEGVEIPDHWVLIVDSSSSMGSVDYVGKGEKYDILMRVCYGVATGLDAAARALRKNPKFGVVNFSSGTQFSGMADFRRAFAENFNSQKRTLLIPQNGGTDIDVRVLQQVEKAIPGGRTIYTLITDGEIGATRKPALDVLSAWAGQADHSLVYVEIGKETEFGKGLREAAKTRASITCATVSKVEEIGKILGSILIRYAK